MRIIFCLISILTLLTACWPSSMSFKDQGSMDPRWQKFYVVNIENNAPNAELSYPAVLTEDIRSGVQNNTRLKLHSNRDSAQVVIEGVVSNYMISPNAIQAGDVAAKSRLTVTCKFNISSKVILREGEEPIEDMDLTVSRFADYNSTSEYAAVKTQLIEEINKQIVQDIINKLMSNW